MSDEKLAELGRRLGAHGVEALLEVTDQTRRKHTVVFNVGGKSDQVIMSIISEWLVTPEKSLTGLR